MLKDEVGPLLSNCEDEFPEKRIGPSEPRPGVTGIVILPEALVNESVGVVADRLHYIQHRFDLIIRLACKTLNDQRHWPDMPPSCISLSKSEMRKEEKQKGKQKEKQKEKEIEKK